MALTFVKLDPNSESPARYAATTGAWPNQRRYLIERRSAEWCIDVSRHVPGKGWANYMGQRTRTLKKAMAECEELANPVPLDRNSSSYTDA